jgi:hypothetical protein
MARPESEEINGVLDQCLQRFVKVKLTISAKVGFQFANMTQLDSGFRLSGRQIEVNAVSEALYQCCESQIKLFRALPFQSKRESRFILSPNFSHQRRGIFKIPDTDPDLHTGQAFHRHGFRKGNEVLETLY